jgi:hypothetical protein
MAKSRSESVDEMSDELMLLIFGSLDAASLCAASAVS